MAEDFEDVFADELSGVPDETADRSRFVGKRGPWDADIVLVGEAPGATEVEEGAPFVGSAGRVLDSILEDVGIDRESVYVTNLVKGRPPENRDPRRDEIEAWWPVLAAELEYVDPALIVTLGAVASQELLDTDRPVGELREERHEIEGRCLVPTYHPAATFYVDGLEGDIRADLERAADLAASG